MNGFPGAGRYKDQSPRVKKTAPSYRMAARKETVIEEDCRLSKFKPGPGRYDPFKTCMSNIGYTISNSSRNQD